MSSIHRLLERINRIEKEVKEDISEIKTDLKSLMKFRWILVGAIGVLVFLIEIAFKFIN